MEKKRIPKRRFREFLEAGEWEETVFNDTFDTNVGNNTLSREQLDYNEGSIRNIHYGDVLINFPSVVDIEYEEIPRIMCEYEKHISKSQLLKNGDIVMADTAEDDTVGKAIEIEGIKDDYVVAGLHTIVCRPKHKVAQNYFGYAVNAPAYHKQLIPLMQGTKVTSINKSALGETIIRKSLEIEEQAKIGDFCRRLDALISLHQQKLSKLKDLKQAYLTEMFPAPGEKRPRRRFKGFSGDWEEVRLGDIGRCQSGIGFPDDEQGGRIGVPFYKVSDMNNIGNERIMTNANNYVTFEQIKNNAWHPIADVPAVIFAKVGAAVLLNRKRMVYQPFLIDNNTMAYKLGDRWNDEFCKSLFDTLNLPSLVQVGALPSYNAIDVENMQVYLPVFEKEQAKIGNFFHRFDTLIFFHRQRVSKLQSLKQAYLSELFV